MKFLSAFMLMGLLALAAADFETDKAYLVVNLDENCRKQQMGEGWFKTINDVPKQAISMSFRQIMKAAAVICTAPDTRKASAIQACVEGPVTNMMPGSILQKHEKYDLFLDAASAAKLKK